VRSNIASTGALAGIAGLALVLSGCGAPPEGGDGGEATDFLPCVVSDAGRFNDKSFNDSALRGIEQAAEELGSRFNKVESTSDDD
jgi:basic membrane protein A